jgi:hypothetical protein
MLVDQTVIAHDIGSETNQSRANSIVLADTLNQFDPIYLSEMSGVRLMKRTDTKYLFSTRFLPEVLSGLSGEYDVLDVSGVRIQHYQTRYFDTPDFKLYHQHHNGQRDRFKLRIRRYLNSMLAFLEVKRKDSQEQTHKYRLGTEAHTLEDDEVIGAFLADHFPLNEAVLVPKLTNQFYRIALVSKSDRERMTIDFGIHFFTPSGSFNLPGLTVAEVKQPAFSVHSDFVRKMRKLGVRPVGFSKYCVGAALAYPQLKRNAFKPLLLAIRKMVPGGVES